MIVIRTDEDELFFLACRFRSNRDEADRRKIAAEYAAVVDRLVASGTWTEAPPPDAQLPDDYMPKAFDDYWYK